MYIDWYLRGCENVRKLLKLRLVVVEGGMATRIVCCSSTQPCVKTWQKWVHIWRVQWCITVDTHMEGTLCNRGSLKKKKKKKGRKTKALLALNIKEFECTYYPGQKKIIVTAEIFMILISSAITWYHATLTSICNASWWRTDTAGRVNVEPKLDITWSNCRSTSWISRLERYFWPG